MGLQPSIRGICIREIDIGLNIDSLKGRCKDLFLLYFSSWAANSDNPECFHLLLRFTMDPVGATLHPIATGRKVWDIQYSCIYTFLIQTPSHSTNKKFKNPLSNEIFVFIMHFSINTFGAQVLPDLCFWGILFFFGSKLSVTDRMADL